MTKTPRVVLMMVPFAGYDRGLLEGIARYTHFHGPWVFYLSGDYPEVPLPSSDSLSGKLTGLEYVSGVVPATPLPSLRRWGATGVIGRIQSARIARKILAAGLPLIGIDLSRRQLASNSPCRESHKFVPIRTKRGVWRPSTFWNAAFGISPSAATPDATGRNVVSRGTASVLLKPAFHATCINRHGANAACHGSGNSRW